QHQRPARRWLITVAVAATALAIGIGGGITIGRTTAPTPVTPAAPTPSTQAPAPSARPFAAADETWCHQYQSTSTRLADAGEAAGAPRKLAASDLPATQWTPEEITANRRFADYLATWPEGMADLRASAANPALKMLIETSLSGYENLAPTISDGTYVPADFNRLRAIVAAERGILALCKELVG
ncbi:hypothetical protein BKN37_14445, partial [Mycobacterium talmoniae]